MNKFSMNSLSDDDLWLIYNSIREIIDAFESKDEFFARIGVERDYAMSVRSDLQFAIKSRREKNT